jgi:hypothetical protein
MVGVWIKRSMSMMEMSERKRVDMSVYMRIMDVAMNMSMQMIWIENLATCSPDSGLSRVCFMGDSNDADNYKNC